MNNFKDAFISYGRADSQSFATRLYTELSKSGLKIWFDQKDIPFGVDFQNQINDGIEKADNFIFIIAPHSINSTYCQKEIELAIKYNKRIIPLLHVEQITQSIWEQRYPEQEWEKAQEQGLHTGHKNKKMHPVINKINWIYFREGIDDYEKSFAGLIKLIASHQEYVHQHTALLAKALAWERHPQKSLYLLTSSERTKAEEWLKIRFKDGQPPCKPTDLHCTFISESTKNANNLMTQVFICCADNNLKLMEKIATTLMRESFTVWTKTKDIYSGAYSTSAIRRGIEEADNVIYLMSGDSLQSENCQMEISYALSLKKRIIPLLIAEINTELIPPELRSLERINFTDNLENNQELEYLADTDKLIRVLSQDAHYYEQHKIILAKALKWERQKRNPSVLLRGYNLRNAEAWLKVAKENSQDSSIPLQEEFINQSLQQPPDLATDVFISYSRSDSDFARKLNNILQIQNKTTWFDQENIASGTDSTQEIYQGIENANNFLFIISPQSVNSSSCNAQIKYAMNLNKRIVTVLYREVEAAALNPELAKLQWLDFQKHEEDFLTKVGELTRVIDTDPDYVRTHTRLLLKAKEWEQNKRDDSYLLRGKDLTFYVEWKNQSKITKEPAPTQLQLDYLKNSQALPYRQIKFRGVLLTSLLMTTLMFFARFLGIMQPLELATYDEVMRLHPSEPIDNRFLIVDINLDDLALLNKQSILELLRKSGKSEDKIEYTRGSIPDSIINIIFKELALYQPKVIGFDLIRDYETEDDDKIKETLKNTQNLILMCKNGKRFIKDLKYKEKTQVSEENHGFDAPPELGQTGRVGFINPVDDDIKTKNTIFVRQYNLKQQLNQDKSEDFYCEREDSWSLVIAKQYLQLDKQYQAPTQNQKTGQYDNSMSFGNKKINKLGKVAGGYQKSSSGQEDSEKNYKIMLNYRAHDGDINKFAPRMNITEIIGASLDKDSKWYRELKEKIKDKIVLIGFSERDSRQAEFVNTPYGEVTTTILEAQNISQMISFAKGERPMIWWWSREYETIWIFGWALVGGIIFWRFNTTLFPLVTSGTAAFGSLLIICYLTFLKFGGWIPLAPPVIVLIGTGLGVLYLTYRIRRI